MKNAVSGSQGTASSPQLALRRSNHAFCPVCEKPVELMSFQDAASLFHTDVQDIRFLADQSKIHRVHNKKGKVMTCSVSLFECFENRRTRLLDSGIIKELAAGKSA
ncbi:MAG: hypothetical protein AB7F88_13140 [Pyrinomonadaceae bacterium]